MTLCICFAEIQVIEAVFRITCPIIPCANIAPQTHCSGFSCSKGCWAACSNKNPMCSFPCHLALGSSLSICVLFILLFYIFCIFYIIYYYSVQQSVEGYGLCFDSCVTYLQGVWKCKIILHKSKFRPDSLPGLQACSKMCICMCVYCVFPK